jgi:hypothetical protein
MVPRAEGKDRDQAEIKQAHYTLSSLIDEAANHALGRNARVIEPDDFLAAMGPGKYWPFR